MKNLFLGHEFLAMYPLWIYLLIWAVLFAFLFLGRWIFEGRGYNVAYSASWGDASLTGFIILAAWIIRQPGIQPAHWMESKTFHFSIIGFSLISAVISYVWVNKPKQIMDKYHSLLIVPLVVYFILISAFIVYGYGDLTEGMMGTILILVWVWLVMYDAKKDRLNQRKWIAKNRPDWKLKN